jgi:hypothetical protein
VGIEADPAPIHLATLRMFLIQPFSGFRIWLTGICNTTVCEGVWKRNRLRRPVYKETEMWVSCNQTPGAFNEGSEECWRVESENRYILMKCSSVSDLGKEQQMQSSS